MEAEQNQLVSAFFSMFFSQEDKENCGPYRTQAHKNKPHLRTSKLFQIFYYCFLDVKRSRRVVLWRIHGAVLYLLT